MNSRSPNQTTLFNSNFPSQQQSSKTTTQSKFPKKGQKHTPDRDTNPYDFLLSNWTDYFGDDGNGSYNDKDFRHTLIALIYDTFDEPYYKSVYDWGPEKKHTLQEVFIDFQKISQGTNRELNDMFSLFSEHAIDFISAVSLALEKIRINKLKKPKKKMIARFFNVEKFYSINDIKSSMINHFVSIKGIVFRTSPIKLLVTGITFQCVECKANMARRFPDGIYNQPTTCDNEGCKSKMFIPDKSTSQSILYQRVRIQEINDEASVDNSGRLPKSIECELKENLVNSVVSGDIVVVNGILKTERAEDSDRGFNGGKSKVQGLFVSYVDGNSIINVKYQEKHLNHNNEDEFSEDDMKIIETLANTRNIFSLLVKSFCPTIYGQELVKAGIIMAIVGGSNLEDVDKKGKQSQKYRTSIRPDCHILIIGDPGQGKSQMLKFISNIVPRGIYVCGNATSNAGLTVAVTKDAHTGEGSLEAGALVLSDQGVCCIDEFDKMSSEHLSLLEAMEQQTVSIAKSGVMCSLSTRTTVVAAANPKGGHYNKAKNIADNIKISNAILSRFDLIFLLLDHPDPQRDQKLSEHVMKLHNTKKRKRDQFEDDDNEEKENPLAGNVTFSQFQSKFFNNFYAFKQGTTNKPTGNFPIQIQKERMPERQMSQMPEKFCSLTERLTKLCDQFSSNQIIGQNIFRKYIAYVKKNVHPYLSPEAGEVIKNFFITLRENSENNPSLTTTTRQLESLIRLSQARAKLECRQEVTKQDALDVVDLMQESLFDALEDLGAGGSLKSMKGKQVNLNNIGVLSIPKQTKIFVDKIREEAKMKNSFLFEYQELLAMSKSMAMNVGDFSEYIDKLNYQSYLILRGPKLYELNSKN